MRFASPFKFPMTTASAVVTIKLLPGQEKVLTYRYQVLVRR